MKFMLLEDFLKAVKGRLIVSCQALHGSPMDDPHVIAAVARSVELAGAAGLRANGAANIAAVRRVCTVPIIGINKAADRTKVYITPTLASAREVVLAGADVVAVQATEPRVGECDPLPELIRGIHEELGVPVMADVATLREAEIALEAGADIVAGTLSGYTCGSSRGTPDGPDLELVREMVSLGAPVIAEGRYKTPEQVIQALELGAVSVVVGTAITMPDRIAQRFVEALARRGAGKTYDGGEGESAGP